MHFGNIVLKLQEDFVTDAKFIDFWPCAKIDRENN